MLDPYEILGLSRNATPIEIKSAFRNLAKQYHPDHNMRDPKASDKFQAIQKAYEILGDTANRVKFDTKNSEKTYTNKFEPTIFANFVNSKISEFETSKPNSIINGYSSQSLATEPSNAQKPLFNRLERRNSDKDIHINLQIPLRDAALGCLKRKSLENGKIITITVPKAAEHGQKIICKGMGNLIQKNSKNYGDVIVTIVHVPDAPFRLDGKRAILDLPIALNEAVLGTIIQVPTFYGSAMLEIPPNTTGREILRLKDKGWPLTDEKIGDLIVNLKIILPENSLELQKIAQNERLKNKYNPRSSEFNI